MIAIQVTREDIDGGVKGNCYECPVAIAATRVIGREVQVGPTKLTCTGDKPWMTLQAEMPCVAQHFVAWFDRDVPDVPVRPFSFEMPDLGEWINESFVYLLGDTD